MFRIECFCDDKNLAKLKWALFELGAYNVTDQPVKENKPKANGTAPHAMVSRAELVEAFRAYIKKHKLKQLRANDIRGFVASVGRSENSYSYVLSMLKEAGAIKRADKGGTSTAVWQPASGRATKKKGAAA